VAKIRVVRSLHGILIGRREGEHRYFKPATGPPVFSELQGLLIKTTAVADVIRSMLEPFVARIVSAFLYGSIAKTEDHERSDLNLMIVGGGPARKPSPHRDPRAGNPMDFELGQPLLLE
jgi:hypothetical protein